MGQQIKVSASKPGGWSLILRPQGRRSSDLHMGNLTKCILALIRVHISAHVSTQHTMNE